MLLMQPTRRSAEGYSHILPAGCPSAPSPKALGPTPSTDVKVPDSAHRTLTSLANQGDPQWKHTATALFLHTEWGLWNVWEVLFGEQLPGNSGIVSMTEADREGGSYHSQTWTQQTSERRGPIPRERLLRQPAPFHQSRFRTTSKSHLSAAEWRPPKLPGTKQAREPFRSSTSPAWHWPASVPCCGAALPLLSFQENGRAEGRLSCLKGRG